jgi:formylglycine-generating enzyme required for sulfatase activity
MGSFDFLSQYLNLGIGGGIIAAILFIYALYQGKRSKKDYNDINVDIKSIDIKNVNPINAQLIQNLTEKYDIQEVLPPNKRAEYLLELLKLRKLKLKNEQIRFYILSAITSFAIIILFYLFISRNSVERDTTPYNMAKALGFIKESTFQTPDMVKIPSGTYHIGISDKNVESLVTNSYAPKNSFSNEMPQKDIKVTDFYMSKYEITVKQFNDYLKDTRQDTLNLEKKFSSDNQPAINVSWNQAIAYCRWLSEKAGNQFRLPYEIEWEVAAKGNTDNLYAWGNSMPDQNNCNFQYSFINSTIANDKSPTNESVFHIFNMSGNVAEWCMDFYKADHYAQLKDRIIRELPESQNRVIRGGGFQDDIFYLRCTARSFAPANTKSNNIGIRIVSSNNLTKIKEDQK